MVRQQVGYNLSNAGKWKPEALQARGRNAQYQVSEGKTHISSDQRRLRPEDVGRRHPEHRHAAPECRLQDLHVLPGRKGHSFQHETIGLELEGQYADFEKRLAKFLHAKGMRNFSVSLTTDFTPDCPEGKRCVYLSGLDILSLDGQRRVIRTSKRKTRRAVRQLREIGS